MKLLITLLSTLFLFSCGNSETADSTGIGNPSPLAKVNLRFQTSTSNQTYLATSQGDTIHSVIFLFNSLEFMTESTPVQKVIHNTRFAFDLLHEDPSDQFLELEVEEGTYRKLDLYISDENEPFALGSKDSIQSSVRIDIQTQIGNTRILFDMAEVFRLRANEGLALVSGDQKTINIHFPIETWFEQVDWSNCKTNGKLASELNKNLMEKRSDCSLEIDKILASIRKSIRLETH
jgi:hypothetical protein